MNLSVQDLLCQDARIQDLYFNISEMKLSITSLFSVQIMSYLGASDIIFSDVIDSVISDILKYKSWILASWRKNPGSRESHHLDQGLICHSTIILNRFILGLELKIIEKHILALYRIQTKDLLLLYSITSSKICHPCCHDINLSVL